MNAEELAKIITGALNAYQARQTTTVDIRALHGWQTPNVVRVDADGMTRLFVVTVEELKQ